MKEEPKIYETLNFIQLLSAMEIGARETFLNNNFFQKHVKLYKGDINDDNLVAKGTITNFNLKNPIHLVESYEIQINNGTWYRGNQFDSFVIDGPQTSGGNKKKRITTSRKNKKNKKSIKIRRNKKRSLMRS